MGASLAKNPSKEMARGRTRTALIVGGLIFGFVGYILGCATYGYAGLGASSVTIDMGLDALQEMEELRPDGLAPHIPVLVGLDGQPQYFLALHRHAQTRQLNVTGYVDQALVHL